MTGAASGDLLGPLFAPDEVRAVFADRARLQGLLDFEAALARAEAAVDVIPAAAAAAIAAKCRAELFELGELGCGAVKAGNDAIPVVKALTALVAADDPEAARFVHWGATSQDAMDTGLVLQLRAWLAVVEQDLSKLSGAAARLAESHRKTALVGRTWMQHALPITLGLKAAGWLSAIERHRMRLAELRPRLLALQFGGAAGTLAALGDKGLAVADALARELDLDLPDVPWHGQRDRVAELAAAAGLLVGTLGKLARDISLMMQTEVGEAFEPAGEGRGGSSTMPHKRNPVSSAVVLAAAMRVPNLVATMLAAMVQEHERGLGGWHAEWSTLPDLCVLAGGALCHAAETLAGLAVDTQRMRVNLKSMRGLILAEAVQMALGARIGRLAAHDLVEAACKRAVAGRRHLREVLAADGKVTAHLSAAELDRLFDPANYLGVADEFVARALNARRPA
jgi:3-carboxy-cis,cis-muconate cycloisomerase